MSEHYDFHYQPTGSGAISGQQVLQQTEDAINELGDYVNDNVGGAMDVAQQALETVQTAETNAQTALDTANSFSDAIQSAQQDASTALSTAQTAQTTASNANNTAIQAQQDASNALTASGNAVSAVNTLSNTVTALGQRVTTAEGNIGQNTSDITALGQRVTTAEGNITTLQNDVSIAQGNATSAMATAGTVKQQAYVLRYSSSSVTDNSTIAYSTLDNTDNIKASDKVIDSDGKIFSVVSVDTANQTVTVGTALVDLALDANVVHTSGNETISGYKTFSDNMTLYNSSVSVNPVALFFKNKKVVIGSTTDIGSQNIAFRDSADANLTILKTSCESVGNTSFEIRTYNKDSNNQTVSGGMLISQTLANTYVAPTSDNAVLFGSSSRRWSKVYATNYYYGANNVEFSTKFVTTDTNQTISGAKTFSNSLAIYNSDATATTPQITFRNSKVVKGSTTEIGNQLIYFADKNNIGLGMIENRVISNGSTAINIVSYNTDANNDTVSGGVSIIKSPTDTNFAPTTDNAVTCGRPLAKWSDVQTYKVNGLTPSSLSLPSTRDSAIDISSYFTNFNNGDSNQYTPTVNGWIFLDTSGCNALHCFCNTTGNLVHYANTVARANDGMAYVTFPVLANTVFKCTWYTNSTITLNKAWFIPCQGNV